MNNQNILVATKTAIENYFNSINVSFRYAVDHDECEYAYKPAKTLQALHIWDLEDSVKVEFGNKKAEITFMISTKKDINELLNFVSRYDILANNL